MPVCFKLNQRLAGYAATVDGPGGKVGVCYRELIGPEQAAHLQRQLENMQNVLFSSIPGLPLPSLIDHLLVVIQRDLQCTAYVNELSIGAEVLTTGSVEMNAPVYVSQIADVKSVDLGVDVPADCGVVLVRSTGWKRSLFFDLGPILPEFEARTYSLERALAQQALLLLGLLPRSANESGDDGPTRVQHMAAGLARLKQLLAERCEEEAAYQELLAAHPWMLGGLYADVQRHAAFDDRRIPDFTAVRCYDGCHDIVELKQPFLRLFRKDDEFAAPFNDAWNQAEGYLAFATEQRGYLKDEKGMRFENPRCVLLLGCQLAERELRAIRKKESFGGAVTVFTYDHLVETATHVLQLMRTANERVIPTTAQGLANSALQLTAPSVALGAPSRPRS